MASRIPGSRLVECPGAGHMVILERKDRVNGVLEELVAAATTGRAAAVS
jgi:pimeloyl-ACP methyl ester carboxylesterase